MDQYKNAQQAFETADQLCPKDEDTLEFLELLRGKLDEEPEVNESEPVQISPEKLHAETREPHTELDFADFWEDSEHAVEQYVLDPPTDEQIASVEDELVFKLPEVIHVNKENNYKITRLLPILKCLSVDWCMRVNQALAWSHEQKEETGCLSCC